MDKRMGGLVDISSKDSWIGDGLADWWIVRFLT